MRKIVSITLAALLLLAGVAFAVVLYGAVGKPYTYMYLGAAFMISVGALWLWADLSEKV